MEKKTSIVLLASLILIIFGSFLSCRLSKDPKKKAPDQKNISLDENTENSFSFANDNERAEKKSGIIKDGEDRSTSSSETPPKTGPITHYDSVGLDNKVRQQAQHLGVDPKTYRMPVREDPDHTKIYRMLGMHVIVNPNGEEVYVPDEL